jgi:sterol desaturase/sphingolipid hydroxylase (fatty acid hydroxylase superfamily)
MRPLKASQNFETKRMFQSDFLEFFSRIPPWHPPAIFGPVILYNLFRAVQAEPTVWAVPGLFMAGLLFWTLMEYWLHRLVFHYEPKSALGKRLIWILHGVHHDWPNDKMRLVFPPGLSIPLAFLFFFGFQAVLGPVHVYAAFAGLATGYLAYDMIHYATHHFTWDHPVMRYLRAYHMAHHFKHEPTRYGVTSPLWDYVFGTAPRSAS